jgi:hypothetical protein
LGDDVVECRSKLLAGAESIIFQVYLPQEKLLGEILCVGADLCKRLSIFWLIADAGTKAPNLLEDLKPGSDPT